MTTYQPLRTFGDSDDEDDLNPFDMVYPKRRCCSKKVICILVAIAVILLVILGVGLGVGLGIKFSKASSQNPNVKPGGSDNSSTLVPSVSPHISTTSITSSKGPPGSTSPSLTASPNLSTELFSPSASSSSAKVQPSGSAPRSPSVESRSTSSSSNFEPTPAFSATSSSTGVSSSRVHTSSPPSSSPPKVTSKTVSPSPSPSASPLPGLCQDVQKVCSPPSDPRQYRVIHLTNNTLRVLLISNNETSKAAAAMDVYSGSFSDGKVEGLAHFCEHLLFLGTEAFPDEAEYSSFLTSNGGYDNAYTSSENTNYYFSVNSDKLEGALDRFAPFFINPLFKESGVSRELNAVDLEYQKDKGLGGWHVYQLMKTISNPDHPFHNFSIGSKESLNISDIRDKVVHYYDSHYSANLMQLVVYGRENLDQLEMMVRDKFSPIVNNDTKAPFFPGTPFMAPHYTGQIVVYKPLSITPSVLIFWQTQPVQKWYRERIIRVLSILFNTETEGSLGLHVKAMGWATGSSFSVEEDADTFSLFSFNVDLTAKGCDNLVDVIASVYGYVAMLKDNIAKLGAIWSDVKELDTASFNHVELPSNVASFVSDMASLMRTVDKPVDFLSPPERYIRNISDFKEIVESFTPQNANILYANPNLASNITNKSVEFPLDCAALSTDNFTFDAFHHIEPYFSTPYSAYCASRKLQEPWKSAKGKDFMLPKLTKYLPTNLTVLPLPSDPPTEPQLIVHDNNFSVWWMQDPDFRLPNLILKCEAETNKLFDSVTHAALATLYDYYVDVAAYSVIQLGALGGYGVSLIPSFEGLYLQFTGYSDGQVFKNFMQDFLNEITKVANAQEGLLELAYKQALSDLQNYNFSTVPYKYVIPLAKHMLADPHYMNQEVLEEVQRLNDSLKENMNSFIDMFRSSISNLTCYATGNLKQETAVDYSQIVQKSLIKDRFVDGSVESTRVVKLPTGIGELGLLTHTLNEGDPNSALFVLYEIGPLCDVNKRTSDYGRPVVCANEALRRHVLLGVLNLAIKQACFDELRTKQQLGYVVSCGSTAIENIENLYFLVQGEHSPYEVADRISGFVANFSENVAEEKTFNQSKNAYLTILQSNYKNLQDQANIMWGRIISRRFQFNFTDILKNVAEEISHNDFKAFYHQFIYSAEQDVFNLKKQFFVAAFANKAFLNFTDSKHEYKLDDVQLFRESADYWGSEDVSCENRTASSGFKLGFKLEVEIPSNSTCFVSTVAAVAPNMTEILVTFDGSTGKGKLYQIDSSELHPAKWCHDNGKKLIPPKGYPGNFTWAEYLSKTETKAVSSDCFATADNTQ